MKAFIVGAGAQGRVVLDILRAQAQYESLTFVDDDSALRGKQINGARVSFSLDEALRLGADFEMIVALGNPDVRLGLCRRIADAGIPMLNAIHPSAVIMPSACLGRGIVVGATAVVNSNATIGDHVVINTGAVVEHDCKVCEGAALSPGAHLGGRVILGACAFVGTGAIVNSRLSVGARTVVGAGSVVTRDLPDSVMAFGVPARVRKTLDSTFDWSRLL